jgi:hypothetical protein
MRLCDRTGGLDLTDSAPTTLHAGQQVAQHTLGRGVVLGTRSGHVAGAKRTGGGDEPGDAVTTEVAWPQVPRLVPGGCLACHA